MLRGSCLQSAVRAPGLILCSDVSLCLCVSAAAAAARGEDASANDEKSSKAGGSSRRLKLETPGGGADMDGDFFAALLDAPFAIAYRDSWCAAHRRLRRQPFRFLLVRNTLRSFFMLIQRIAHLDNSPAPPAACPAISAGRRSF